MGKRLTLLCCVLSLGGMTAQAETVYVPIGQQASEKQTIERPQSGMTKAQVKEKFGEPTSWREAVGTPPISSWVYPDYTVYFEYEYVLHSVLTTEKKAIN